MYLPRQSIRNTLTKELMKITLDFKDTAPMQDLLNSDATPCARRATRTATMTGSKIGLQRERPHMEPDELMEPVGQDVTAPRPRRTPSSA